MAVYRYATKDLSINNAEAFISAMNASDGRNTKNSVILYAVIGNVFPYVNEPTPVNPEDNEQYLQYQAHRDFIGGKRITTEDVSHVTTRHNWTSGTIYSMYRDTDTDMYDRAYYVLTDQNNVYKCLFNNKGGTSTVKPTGFSTSSFTTSDGYTWKYMYSITLGEANKFLTAVHMPVKTISASEGSVESDRQIAVQNAAVNGSIEVIETVSTGAGYLEVENGIVASGGKFTIRISNDTVDELSSDNNEYTESSVYIISGTGAGQLRRIIDYSSSTRVITVNTAFATTPNTDSRIIISPTATIIGDGIGAKAYTRVSASGTISNINMITIGSRYTRADCLITANSGIDATANVVISPVGGHGSNPIRELAADKVLLNVKLGREEGTSSTGAGYIPSNTEFRTISILKDPVLKCDANNDFVTLESIANTSNSPNSLRFTTRLQISYNQMNQATNLPINPVYPREIITNKRLKERAELGTLQFVTDTNPIVRANKALSNAVKAANGNIVYVREDETVNDPSFYTVYINNVEGYGPYNPPFTKDDVILRSTSESEIATIEAIKGPEANTFSGEIMYIENIQAVTRDPDQTEDIKIVLDF